MSVRLQKDTYSPRSEILLEEILGRIAEAVFVLDKQGRFLYVNRAACEERGYTESELLKLNVRDINLPESAKFAQDRINEVIRNGQATFETIHVRKDGSTFPVEITSRMIMAGDVKGMIAVARDISWRVEEEERLKASEEKYRELFEDSPLAIFRTTATGGVELVNKALARMLGFETPKEVLDNVSNVGDLYVYPEKRKKLFELLKKTGVIEDYEVALRRRDGSVFWGSYNARAVLDDKGQVVGLEGQALDISERKAAEIEIQEYQRLLEGILNSSDAPIFSVDNKGRYTSFNQAHANTMKMTYGVDIEIGRKIFDYLTHAWDRKHAQANFRRVLRGERFSEETEYGDQKKARLFFELTYNPMLDSHGKVVGASLYGRNITERRLAEERLAEANTKLESTLKAIPDMMFEVDTTGYIYDYHAPANDLLYAPPETFVGRNVEDVLPEPAAAVCLKAVAKAAAHGWSRGDVYSLELPKAGKRWFELAIDTKNHSGKENKRLLVIARDITDRILAEESVKHERDTAQMYLDIVNTVVVAINAKGKVIMINRYGADLLGYSEEEIVGKPWFSTFIPYHERIFVENVFEKVAKGKLEGVDSYDNAVLCKNGEERLISWRNRFVNDDKGKFKFAVSSGVDITDVHEARYEVRQSYSQLQKIVDGIVKALAMTVETRDPYTAGHQRRVAQLAVAMARLIGWSEIRIKGLEMAATIHDIGKMYVPAEILNKPGKLDPVEFELIKLHSTAGFNIVKDIQFAEPVAAMVRQHHERLDGTGYPDGLKHQDIVPGAKVMAVADVVEAMSSDRPYRPGRGLNAALQEVQDRKGGLYDPEAVEACLELFVKAKFKFD